MEKIYTIQNESEIDTLDFKFSKGERIFLIGDLGAGKSTFVRNILRKFYQDDGLVVRSPTYTYYQKYEKPGFPSVYHFDLYRIEDISVWDLIGGEEIWADYQNIILIEWPEIISKIYQATQEISITKGSHETERIISIHSENKDHQL